MLSNRVTHRPIDVRERGSVYILVLGASLLVATIGISSLMAARVQRRAAALNADQVQAREMARTGIDRVMHAVEVAPTTWRIFLSSGTFDPILTFDKDTRAIVSGVDPVDNNLSNDIVNPVILTSTGQSGDSVYILRVTVNGDGTIQPGSWERMVN